MNDEQKCIAVIIASIAAVAITGIIAGCWYNLSVEKAAIAAGLEQVSSEHGLLWARPKEKP